MNIELKRKLLFIYFVTAIIFFTISTNRARADGNSVDVIHEGYDRFPSVGSTITLVRAEEVVIVSDPGMIKSKQLIIDGLNNHGIGLNDVTHVFLTHEHTDHTINVGMFPNAKVISALGIFFHDHWKEYNPNGFIVAPGVTVLATPGHTNEDLSLLVETEKGTYAITHAWWHTDLTPIVDPFAEAPEILKISREKILSMADWIIPSHGAIKHNSR